MRLQKWGLFLHFYISVQVREGVLAECQQPSYIESDFSPFSAVLALSALKALSARLSA